jgi:AsmA-like C-terminal region
VGLLPLSWRATPALWQGPARLSVEARGPQEALSADVNLALADARLEASPTINLHSGEWSAAIAVRHPGARRLIAALGLPKQEGLYALPEWLGDGSLSLLAQLAGRPGRLDVKQFDLTAATLHARGGLTFDLGHGEPSVSGRVDTDAVTLPVPSGASRVPLPLNVLRGWRGDVQLAAGRLAAETGPVVTDATARFSLADGRLRIEDFTAKLGSGAVAGSLAFSADASPPALEVQARVTDAAITGPFGDGLIDLLSGRADAILRVSSVGYSPSAMLATLNGSFSLKLHDGATSGFDLFRLKQAIEKPDPKSAQTAAEDALQSGTTGFDRLEIAGSIAHGDLVIESASMTGAAGEARASGRINLAADTIDARIAMEPTLPDPPQVTLRLTGPIDRPNRMTELSDLARWMAALVH